MAASKIAPAKAATLCSYEEILSSVRVLISESYVHIPTQRQTLASDSVGWKECVGNAVLHLLLSQAETSAGLPAVLRYPSDDWWSGPWRSLPVSHPLFYCQVIHSESETPVCRDSKEKLGFLQATWWGVQGIMGNHTTDGHSLACLLSFIVSVVVASFKDATHEFLFPENNFWRHFNFFLRF